MKEPISNFVLTHKKQLFNSFQCLCIRSFHCFVCVAQYLHYKDFADTSLHTFSPTDTLTMQKKQLHHNLSQVSEGSSD